MTAAVHRLTGWRHRPFAVLMSSLPFLVGIWLVKTTPAAPAGSLQPMLPSLALLQTFPAPGSRGPLPRIWRDRLPMALMERLQRQSASPWAQAWSSHGGTPPFLILRDVPSRIQVRESFRWGPYTIVAADPLSRQALQADLQRPLAAGHRRRCPLVDGPAPALFWSSDALASLAGPLVPLLQPWQEGCLRLGSEGQQGGRLTWSGQVTSQPPLVGAAATVSPSGAPPDAPAAPLELEGTSLAPLLGSLLRQGPLLSELRQHYGLSAALQEQLLGSPFRLRVTANGADAPYRVTLLVALPRAAGAASPARSLAPLLTALARDLPDDLQVVHGGNRSRVVDAAGQVRGGWLQEERGVVFSLGGGPDPAPLAAGPVAVARGMRLTASPRTLDGLQLLPEALPMSLRRSPLLQADWTPDTAGAAAAQFTGWLSPAAGSPSESE